MLDVLVLGHRGWEVLSRRALAVPATMGGTLALDQRPCIGNPASSTGAPSHRQLYCIK